MSQCNGRTYNPKVDELATRQIKSLQPEGQGGCSKAGEELTIQRSMIL